MSYNYLLNSFDGSIGCEIKNTEAGEFVTTHNRRLNGNDGSESVSLKQLPNHKNQVVHNDLDCSNVNSSPETNITDKNLRLSEKLKVLLKNGKSKGDILDLPDPYAFTDSEQPSTDLLISRALNHVKPKGVKNSMANINGTMQQSIMFPKTVSPQMSHPETFVVKECNGEGIGDLKKTMKMNKLMTSGMGTNSFVTSDLQQYKLQQNNHNLEHNKVVSGLKNGKTAQVHHLPPNNKPLVNRLFGKSKLQNVKSTNFIEALKASRNLMEKQANMSQAQAQKQGPLKGSSKPDARNKTFQKGKSLLNQLQKTALMNRPGMSQQIRKNLRKGPFFGMNKTIQKQVDVSSTSPLSNNKNVNKKSLLEESLLGLKSHGSDKVLTNDNGLKSMAMDVRGLKSETNSTAAPPNPPIMNQSRLRTNSLDQGKHESLERIWNIRNKLKRLKRDHHNFGLTINNGDYDDNLSSECLLFQNYWFSACGDSDSTSNNDDRRRDTKLSQLKVELRHKIKQLQWRYKDEYRDKVVELLVESARKQPNLTAFLIRLENSEFNGRKKTSRVKPFNLLRPVLCTYTFPDSGRRCQEQAMPCIKFCQQHITQSNDQLLFTSCTARKSDNTTCQAAVLNQNMENPLCLEHKRLMNKSEMPKNIVNSRPVQRQQQRKRSRLSTGGSNKSGRSRKRRRSSQKDRKELANGSVGSSAVSATQNSSSNFNMDFVTNGSFEHQNVSVDKINPQIITKCDVDESQEVEVGEEVLAIAEDLPLELASQATKLLEEHDFTNVLNHIPADAFNDLFTEDKEEYEPTPQETEELERALEAVDKDVKSLEKLSQTQGILDTLLDEQTIAQTLAQLPEVTANIEVPQTLVPVFYQNGFSNINQLEQTLNDVNKSLSQTVMLNQSNEGMVNHFSNITIPNHADVLQS